MNSYQCGKLVLVWKKRSFIICDFTEEDKIFMGLPYKRAYKGSKYRTEEKKVSNPV